MHVAILSVTVRPRSFSFFEGALPAAPAVSSLLHLSVPQLSLELPLQPFSSQVLSLLFFVFPSAVSAGAFAIHLAVFFLLLLASTPSGPFLVQLLPDEPVPLLFPLQYEPLLAVAIEVLRVVVCAPLPFPSTPALDAGDRSHLSFSVPTLVAQPILPPFVFYAILPLSELCASWPLLLLLFSSFRPREPIVALQLQPSQALLALLPCVWTPPVLLPPSLPTKELRVSTFLLFPFSSHFPLASILRLSFGAQRPMLSSVPRVVLFFATRIRSCAGWLVRLWLALPSIFQLPPLLLHAVEPQLRPRRAAAVILPGLVLRQPQPSLGIFVGKSAAGAPQECPIELRHQRKANPCLHVYNRKIPGRKEAAESR
mmetsp:Transcript_5406/g.13580  ORF Transcript_5406/g.13580 Transcript_5406/m.13580 type:complete len:369 (-) Transcript_5406:2734-3840(-)